MKQKLLKPLRLRVLMLVALLCAGFTSAWGEEVTFAPSDFSGQGTSGTGSVLTGATKSDVTITGEGYGNTSYLQVYAKNFLTVTPNNGATITKIVLTATNVSYIRTWSASDNSTVSVSNTTATWSGSSTSAIVLTNTASAQARITSIGVTYTASGTTPTTYTVTYDANGGTGSMTDSNSPYNSGSTVTVLGNSFTRDGYTFKSWNTAANGSGTSYDEDDTFSISDNTTLYAQWTENTPAGNYNWVLTDISALTATDVFVIVGNNYAMTNNNGTSSAPAAIKVTVEDGKITTSPEDNIIWTLSGDATNGYTFYPNGSTETWLYCNTTAASGSNNNMRVGKGNRKVFELKNGHLWTKDTYTSRCLSIYSNQDWRGYTSTDNAPTLKFYKRVRANEPTLAASNVELAYDATSGSIAYTLTNASGGTMSATSSADWLTIGSVEETIPFTCEANPSQSERSAIITLTYTLPTSGTLTATATVTQAANPDVVSTIAQVRNQGTGDVQTKGIVTSVIGKTAYIQDDNAAIVVYDSKNDLTVSVGNEIKVRGRLSTFNGLLEITSPTVTILSEGKNVTPEVMTIAEVNSSNNQGWLVKIEDATVTAINDQNVTIAQGDNTIIVRFNSSNDINVSNSDIITLTGNIGCYNTTKQIANPTDISKKELIDVSLTFSGVPATIVINETATYAATANPLVTGITYQSSDENVVSVNANNGEIEAKAIGTATITASYAGDASYKAATASYTIEVVGPVHTAKFSINGKEQTDSEVDVNEGKAITFPSDPETILGKQFVGWTTATIDGETDDKPATLVNAATMGNADVTYYAVFANVTAGTSTNTVDELTLATTGVSGNNYEEWSGKTAASNAVYAGQSAGSYKSIQLRSDNNNSGVISTTSGGRLKKIEVIWESNTTTGRTLNIYGSNSVYNTPADLYNTSKQGTLLGTMKYDGSGIGTTTSLTVDGDYKYIGLRSASGAMYLASISITWENSTPATYSGYCTTVVAPVKPAKPIIFHDGGEYEGELTVAIAGEGTIKYTLNGDAEQTYTKPFTIDATTTIKAWTEQDGATSEVVEKTFTIKKTEKPAINLNGYYRIKGGDGNYVNVAGRKTVTFVDEAATATAAGTVIKVETENAQVKVLRSQGVDVPGYAEKAMRYVPKIVQLVAEKLGAVGEGNLLGKDGLGKIMDKFNESFDYHLYLEEAGENGYRIYGRTPSMKPVVDFYAENKADVDAKLPQLEQFINDAIKKVLAKTNGSGSSILVPFELETVWQNMDGTLTEPVDEASTARFYEEVLSSETNVWNFAYETAMIYWTKLKNHKKFEEYRDKLGDYAKYIDKVENIRPNFKYYIVQKGGEMDIISEGNGDIVANSANTIWTLEDRTEFSVAFNEENVLNNKYYTTLYTDFAYTLPEGEGVKAYKVTKVSEAGVAVKVEMKGIIPAQTPVLLESESKENQTLILSTEDGTAPTDNLLAGADKLIKEYQIKTAQVKALFDMAKEILGENTYNNYVKEYEHLMLRYAGTVNNKYFFGLSQNDMKGMKNVRMLNLNDAGENLGFYSNWVSLEANKALIIDSNDPVKLMLKGDVNRDGIVSIADVTALVNIILGKATYPADADKYDFDAAHVNADEDITIADVTALVNIILGKTQN